MAVLGETLDRLDYLSYVPTEIDPQLTELLEEEGCIDVATVLNKQWQIEDANSAKGDPSQARSGAGSDQQMYTNTRSLCRALRSNAVAVETLYQSSNQVGSKLCIGSGFALTADVLCFIVRRIVHRRSWLASRR